MRKGYKGEHFLGRKDLKYARRVFDDVRISHESVLYTYSRFFNSPTDRNRAIARWLRAADERLFRYLPITRRFYSLAYLQMIRH